MEKERGKWMEIAAVFMACLFLAAVAWSAPPIDKGRPGDKGPPPGKGETGEVNHLSYPAAFTSGLGTVYEVLDADTFVWGCPNNAPDAEYPNFACVNTLGEPISPENCILQGAPCAGFTVAELERIYGQKIATNTWKADTAGPLIDPTDPLAPPVLATHVDWGDNLESTTWNANSIIRVETTPFATLGYNQLGYQMWHIFGQGPSEQWGVRAQNGLDVNGDPVPYTYLSSYAIIKDAAEGTGKARINIAQLAAGADCMVPEPVYPATWIWEDDDSGYWSATADGFTPYLELHDVPYTVELNVGGKYVYGYNWTLRRDVVADKTGWWRLTFYTTDGSIEFDPGNTSISAPILPTASAGYPSGVVIMSEGPLYVPVVEQDLTYLDICVEASQGKGGGNKPN